MIFMSVLFLLSAMTMTQAEDISDDLKTKPLSETLFLFEVVSDSPVDDIVGALNSMTRRHTFKVIGERRYFFVALASEVEVLRQVNFPEGSTVTQYPVEHANDFLKMFGKSKDWAGDDKKDMYKDKVLIFTEWEILLPKNTPSLVYSSEMAKYAELYGEAHASITCAAYAAIASYPPKLFFFSLVEANALQKVINDGLDTVGGPGNLGIRTKLVVKLH